MYDVVYLPLAKRDLGKAVAYIVSELAAPDAALELINLLDMTAAGLVQMPYRYSIYPVRVSLSHEIRFVPLKGYNLFYRVKEETRKVEIMRILHQRQQARIKLE